MIVESVYEWPETPNALEPEQKSDIVCLWDHPFNRQKKPVKTAHLAGEKCMKRHTRRTAVTEQQTVLRTQFVQDR